MANSYYNHTSGEPASESSGLSSLVRAEFDLIEAGFTAAEAEIAALDVAESGSFTPRVSDGSNNATLASSDGRYYKIGKVVYAWFSATLSSKGSCSGNFRLYDMPYAVASGGANGSVTIHDADNFSGLTPYSLYGYLATSQSYLSLRYSSSLGMNNILIFSNIADNFTMSGSVIYRTT